MGRLGTTEIIILLFLLPVYFLPTFIAIKRKKPNVALILLLNFFLGWTVAGWVIALIWASGSGSGSPAVVVNNHQYAHKEEKIEFPGQSLHNKLDSLRRLKDLLDSGALSQEEYEQEKAKLLGR